MTHCAIRQICVISCALAAAILAGCGGGSNSGATITTGSSNGGTTTTSGSSGGSAGSGGSSGSGTSGGSVRTGFSGARIFNTGGTSPNCVQTADVNSDGKLDLILTNRTSNNVSVLLGNGDGTFQAAMTYALGSGPFPQCAAVADFNGDGKPDIAVANALVGTSGGTISMLINRGDGTFLAPVNISSNVSPLSITAADFNGDGHQDLFVGGNGNSAVLLGKGDGTFQAPVLYQIGSIGGATGVATGDFNRDGRLDIVGTVLQGFVGILLNGGSGAFISGQVYPVEKQPMQVAVGDLNGDGKLDLAVTDYGTGDISVSLGNGDGTFQPQTSFPAGSQVVSLALADFFGRGRLDIVVTTLNAAVSGNGVRIYLGNGDGTFTFSTSLPTGPHPSFVTVGDFNGDGSPDIAVTDSSTNMVDILITQKGTPVSGGSGGTGSGGGASSGGGNTSGTAPLSGQYAFDLAGFDLSGYPMALAGSITADGQGHITAGSVDVNDFGQLNSSTAVSGTYTLDSNYRGLITLNSVGTIPYPLMFNFTLKADGTLADLIEDNQSSQTFFFTTGRMQKQDPTAFSLPSLAGSYSFLLESNMQCRRSSVGRFTLNPDGTTSNGLVDISNGGIGPILTAAGLSANFAAAGPDANGRGTLKMVDSDAATTYAYYAVSTDELLLIETDAGQSINCGFPPTTIYSGMAAKQTFLLSPAAVNTAGSVFWLTGLNAAIDQSTATIGVIQISSGNTASVQWDTNNNDNFFGPTSMSGTPVNFDPNTGRGTISVSNGSAQGFVDQAAFYLVDSGTAFLLEVTPGNRNQALAGIMEPQVGIGSFSASTISGDMIGGTTTGNSINDIQTFDLLFSAQSNGTISSIQDENNRGCDPTLSPYCTMALYGFNSNVTVSSIAISGIDPMTGRGVLATPNPNGGSPAKEILYLIGPSHFAFIDETPPGPNVFTPIWGFTPIFRFDPQ